MPRLIWASASCDSHVRSSDPRLYRPHVVRNREPILDVLRRVLPRRGSCSKSRAAVASMPPISPQQLPSLIVAAERSGCRGAGQHRRAPRGGRRVEPAAAAAARCHGEHWPVAARRRHRVQQHDPHRAVVRLRRPDRRRRARLAGRRHSLSLRPLQDRRPAHRAEQSRPSTPTCARAIRNGASATSPMSRRWQNVTASPWRKPCRCRPIISSVIFRRGG